MDQGGAPPTKKARVEDGGYIPCQKGDGPNTSIVFSLKERKGALFSALKPFKVV